MLNIEYYKDKLVELGVIGLDKLAIAQGQLRRCNNSVMCDDCLFNSDSIYCSDGALNWLLTEYKEEKEEKEVDWSKVKVDTPILVKSEEKNLGYRRYFAKFEDGKVYAWVNGGTSWTRTNDAVRAWEFAKLAESEETVWQRSELQKN